VLVAMFPPSILIEPAGR